MTLAEHLERLARAANRAAAEHGAPNGFTFAELFATYGGPPPQIAARAAKRYARALQLQGITLESGYLRVLEEP